jgi:hypothetical protein
MLQNSLQCVTDIKLKEFYVPKRFMIQDVVIEDGSKAEAFVRTQLFERINYPFSLIL